MPSHDGRVYLGLDPATQTGVSHSGGFVGTWLLRGDKLACLRKFLYEAHGAWGFDAIAYEDAHQGSRNRRVIQFHNELAGVIKLCGTELGVEVLHPYNPMSIKKWATGNGHATKAQMIRAARTFYGFECRHGFAATEKNPVCLKCADEADALFVLKMAEGGYVPRSVEKKAARKRERKQRKTDPRLFV